MEIALATYPALPALDRDDGRLIAAFAREGVTARPEVWSEEGVDWGRYGAIVLRSTWDYFTRYDDFREWIGRPDVAARLLNPSAFVRWNLDKHYLRELAAEGVATVSTVWTSPGQAVNLEEIAARTGWRSLLVKPAVSAGAFATFRVVDDGEARRRVAEELRAHTHERAFLVQPYLPSVEEGERSLLYFGETFSHALLKKPVRGDFRVQETFGGVASAYDPTAAERDLAERALAASRRLGRARGEGDLPLVYARVDLLEGEDGEPRLIELEAIEPSLYFAQTTGGEGRFVSAVRARLPR